MPEGKGKLALLVAGPPPGGEGGKPSGPGSPGDGGGLEVAADDVMAAMESKDAAMFRAALADFVRMVRPDGGE